MSETPAPASSRASAWEDFVDVFISPAELFRRRADGKFGLALVVLIILSVVLYFATRTAMQPIVDAEFARAMAANPNVTPERLEAMKKMAATFTGVGVVIAIPIVVFLLGAVIWLAGRLVGGRVSYLQGATIATFAYFPKLIEGVSNAVQALLLDEASLTSRFSVSLGLGRFLHPGATSPVLLAFLGRVDFFTLWVTVLVAVGLKQMGRITTGQAAAAGVIVWLIGSLPSLLPALLAALRAG